MIQSFLSPKVIIAAFIMLLVFGGITVAILAYVAPEYLFAAAVGLGALAFMTLVVIVVLRQGQRGGGQ